MRRVAYIGALLGACAGSHAATIQYQHITWPGRSNLRIHYASARPASSDATPIVFLPGFGVGTFHFSKQLEALGEERPAYALDWLGQGESWPEDEAAEQGLRYDADLWTDQLEAFCDEVLGGEPVILAGNSLGGFLGTQLALRRGDLVRGLALMNATPLWSFVAPIDEEDAFRPFGWDATLPAPAIPYAIGSRWFDTLRNPLTVATMLGGVYADARAVTADEELPKRIVAAASKRGGHSAFTSILFSPKTKVSFEDALLEVSGREAAPAVGLFYGREDPWVVPLWGDRAFRRATGSGQSVGADVVHFHISPAGHCPHHEAPEVTNQLLATWARALDQPSARAADLMPDTITAEEHLDRVVRATRVDGKPIGLIERVAARFDRVRAVAALPAVTSASAGEE